MACWLAGLLACWLMLAVPDASGQDIEAVRFETVDWVFVPAIAGNDEILGFLSWTDTNVIGQNISLIWYEYDVNDGSFATFAWKHADVGAAALWLRQNFSEEHFFSMNDELPDFISVADSLYIVAPKPFTNGLFDDDPLVPVVNSADDPQLVVDTLSAIGYEAAPSVSGMSVSVGGNGFVQIGAHPVPIDVACIVAAGSLEAMMLNDLYNRAQSFVVFGVDLPDNRSCGWPCTCSSTVAHTAVPPGTWTVATNTTTCRYSRPANKVTTYTGDTWLLCNNCARTVTTLGVQNFQSNRLPGDSCPPAPPTGSVLTWTRFGLPGYP